jgi:hypothetical protein
MGPSFLQAFQNRLGTLGIVPADPKLRPRMPRIDDPEATEGFACHPAANPLAFEGLPPELGLLRATRRTISSSWRSAIFPATPGRRFGKSIAARWLIRAAEEFGPQDADLIGGVDADLNPVPGHCHDGDGDVVADDYLLAGFPGQNYHVMPP